MGHRWLSSNIFPTNDNIPNYDSDSDNIPNYDSDSDNIPRIDSDK